MKLVMWNIAHLDDRILELTAAVDFDPVIFDVMQPTFRAVCR